MISGFFRFRFFSVSVSPVSVYFSFELNGSARFVGFTGFLNKRLRKILPLEDIPYLFHRIQSLLPVNDSARLCVLSKSWLQAWFTIPTLRFLDTTWLCQEQERDYNNVINRTLVRYHKDNIPIESINLTINIKNQELTFLAEKWVHFLASKSSLKELYLTIGYWDLSFFLTSEIFSSSNLITVSVKLDASKFNSLWISDNPNHVNCVSLRVLELHHVRISEELLHKLWSTCTLLEKISLFCCKGIKSIKINNLLCLREVKFESGGQNDVFAINDVPSLKLFSYDSALERRKKHPPFSICSLGSITELYLDGVVVDASLVHIIESKLPFLESLTLDMRYSQLGNLEITSVSLKRMTLKSLQKARPVYIQVNPPKLLYFCYGGWNNIASLLFTTITPEHITIILTFTKMVDHLFFLNMSEVLNLSSKFDLYLKLYGDVVQDIDDLRRNLTFPAKNIQKLSLDLKDLKGPWLKHIFFDVFFSVCHPNYVSLYVNKLEYPFKLLAREVLKYWHDYPQDVEIRNPLNGECRMGIPNDNLDYYS